MSCVVRWRSLRRADHSSRGVLPTAASLCDLETSRIGAPCIYIYDISNLRVKIIVIINNRSNGDKNDDDRKKNKRRIYIRGEKSGAIDEKMDRNPQTDTCCCPCSRNTVTTYSHGEGFGVTRIAPAP